MENHLAELADTIKPNVITWCSAALGIFVSWFTGLPPLARALIFAQLADIVTGIVCAATGKSEKSATGKISSHALFSGVVKKGLEWLVVLVCVQVGAALGVANVSGAALTYMIATELISFIENLKLFGLDIPILDRILDVANGSKKEDAEEP